MAENLAAIFDGTVTPFHSYIPISEMDGPYMLGLGPTPQEDFEEMESILTDRLKEIAADKIEQSYLSEPVVSIGNPGQAIVEEAKDYDMIVMSTHGRTGFTRFFLGSVAEKVLRTSHKPVLVVDKKSRIDEIERIMLTTDFSDNSLAAFPFAKEIAVAADAELELLHILSYDPHNEDEPDESKISLREQRLEILSKEELHDVSERLITKVIVSSDTPHEAILNYNLNNPHDLVVMATLGRTGIEYLMMGSTTANVVRHVTSPVLSINPKKKEELYSE